MLRIRHKANVQIYEDTTQKDALFAPDDAGSELVIDGYQRHNDATLSVPANGGTQLVPLGDVGTVKGIFIRMDGDFDLTLNGGTPLQIRKGVDAGANPVKNARFFAEMDVSSALITNNSTTAALTGVCVVWGDPVVAP